jgi:hypothetical protein
VVDGDDHVDATTTTGTTIVTRATVGARHVGLGGGGRPPSTMNYLGPAW